MKTVCAKDQCSGCNACKAMCRKDAITIVDSVVAYNAVIDPSKCVECNMCMKVCPNNETVELRYPERCIRGWANAQMRKMGSSGGVASEMIRAFIQSGGFVCSCLFERGKFVYKVISDCDEAHAFAGSKYVKSDPADSYIEIKALLKDGNRVLFIGLPCHVAGLKKTVGEQPNLYTVDLICHGTPSPKLLEGYLSDKRIDLSQVQNIQFRDKNNFGLRVNGNRIVGKRVVDSYTNAFLAGVNYTENCYSCKFATIKRAADITLGDFWGCDAKDMANGVSLILCQSAKGQELLELSDLVLEDADMQRAIEHNHQLAHPTPKTTKRNTFLAAIQRGEPFQMAYFRINPKDAVKQSVKTLLSKMKFI